MNKRIPFFKILPGKLSKNMRKNRHIKKEKLLLKIISALYFNLGFSYLEVCQVKFCEEATKKRKKTSTLCEGYRKKTKTTSPPSPYFTTILATFWCQEFDHPKNVSFFHSNTVFEVHRPKFADPSPHSSHIVIFFGGFPNQISSCF